MIIGQFSTIKTLEIWDQVTSWPSERRERRKATSQRTLVRSYTNPIWLALTEIICCCHKCRITTVRSTWHQSSVTSFDVQSYPHFLCTSCGISPINCRTHSLWSACTKFNQRQYEIHNSPAKSTTKLLKIISHSDSAVQLTWLRKSQQSQQFASQISISNQWAMH